MSDIPVGSPPVPPGRHAAPSGWYTDPVDGRQERYWDGWQWSRNTRPGEAPPQYPGQTPPQQPRPYGEQPSSYPYAQPPNPQPIYQTAPQAAAYGQAGPTTADGVPLAGWWWRVLALIIDSLIVGLVAAVIAAPIYLRIIQAFSASFDDILAAAKAGEPAPPQPPITDFLSTTDQMLLAVISVVVEAIFVIVFLRWKSATPGKLAVGLRVVPVDQGRYAGRLSWITVLVRAAVWVLPLVTNWLLLLRVFDALYPLWHPKRQALHDLAAKTQVVKIR